MLDIIDGPRKWGSLVNKTTNSFNGMIGMVQRGVLIRHSENKFLYFNISSSNQEAELAMGSITSTPLRDTAVDFSYPYFFNRLGFITKKPSPLPKFMAILWPYQKNVWITTGVMVPVFSLIYWIFLTLQQQGGRNKCSFGSVLQEVSQMLVMQGLNII